MTQFAERLAQVLNVDPLSARGGIAAVGEQADVQGIPGVLLTGIVRINGHAEARFTRASEFFHMPAISSSDIPAPRAIFAARSLGIRSPGA
ncbi:MAG: hypothetical protein A4E73_01336 [Syntrophaceae bacterium PtaU1.Bin231]|nr:MAG: hypothetical protein A4E73_01336 [Syntrophaceae bacterium PtaU1.Bin231]